MVKPTIIITGKNGQLGWELQQLQESYNKEFEFIFADKEELDLSNPDSIPAYIQQHKPSYFINCGAYTLVDKAETEQELTYKINAESVGVIAKECSAINCKLITISTDYVFAGDGKEPYKPEQPTNPINYYGYSKWLGEKLALENNPNTIIVRTSWVYSFHGNNFVKTMLRLMKEREELKVVADQVGSPTYAADLAQALMQIVVSLENGNSHTSGIYHYSNEGVISWFNFATAIAELSGSTCKVLPITTDAYPTPAKRPAYSVMDKQSIQDDFRIELKNWKDSLKVCLDKLEMQSQK